MFFFRLLVFSKHFLESHQTVWIQPNLGPNCLQSLSAGDKLFAKPVRGRQEITVKLHNLIYFQLMNDL